MIKSFRKYLSSANQLIQMNYLISDLDANARETDKRLTALEAPKTKGAAVLVGGTILVNNPNVRSDTIILLTPQIPGGTQGFLSVSSRVEGVSFTITSSNALDTSTVGWYFA